MGEKHYKGGWGNHQTIELKNGRKVKVNVFEMENSPSGVDDVYKAFMDSHSNIDEFAKDGNGNEFDGLRKRLRDLKVGDSLYCSGAIALVKKVDKIEDEKTNESLFDNYETNEEIY